MTIFKNKYRIVKDDYLGFEAQVMFWWFPFVWLQMHDGRISNTFATVEKAEEFIKYKTSSFVVKMVKP